MLWHLDSKSEVFWTDGEGEYCYVTLSALNILEISEYYKTKTQEPRGSNTLRWWWILLYYLSSIGYSLKLRIYWVTEIFGPRELRILHWIFSETENIIRDKDNRKTENNGDTEYS